MSGSESQDYVIIGRFNAPFGVKGWIKIYSYTDPMENMLNYRPWLVKQQNAWMPIKVEATRKQGKGLIVKLDQIDTPEAARGLLEQEIATPKSVLPSLEEGDYYWSELVNLKVFTESGVLLGRVDHLLETGANDVLVVKGDQESIDRETRLIPYVPDQVVKEIDLDAQSLKVDWDPEF